MSVRYRATNLAIESALSHCLDLPVGAVAASGDWIVGRYFASDRRTGYCQMHAEYMSIMDYMMTDMTSGAPAPDTVIVSLEPCDNCQDFLATHKSIKRVGFGLPRKSVEERGLVKPHSESIYERAERMRLPYEVFQVNNVELRQIGEIILDHTRRDPQKESVMIDHVGLQQTLSEYSER